jgi:hypothetical protein
MANAMEALGRTWMRKRRMNSSVASVIHVSLDPASAAGGTRAVIEAAARYRHTPRSG